MTKQTWISVHLFYHQNLHALLTDCVQPLIDELRAEQSIERFFFMRYWQGGPHIRLRLLPATQASREMIQQTLERRAGRFFAVCPAGGQMPEEEYRQVVALYSQFEYGLPDDTPLYPNNSLQYVPYAPEFSRYGDLAAMPIVERHFMESSEIVLELLGKEMTQNQWTGQALAMMLSGLLQYTDEMNVLARIFESYCLWSGSVFGVQRAAYMERFARQYQRQSQHLQKLVEHLLSIKRQDAFQESSLLADWARSIYVLKQDLRQLAQQGSLSNGLFEEMPDSLTEIRFGSLVGVILSCLHMHNNRLGVSLFEEAYLAFLLYKSLAALHGGEAQGG